MAFRRASSTPSRIMRLDEYINGEEFSLRDVCDWMPDLGRGGLAATLKTMVECGELIKTKEHHYKKPMPHWIHSMRLANPVPVEDEHEAA